MKILVTGATGFIGTPLCHRLANRGHEVIALSRGSHSQIHSNHAAVTTIRGDITSASEIMTAMKSTDACFHLAALAKPFAKRKSDFYKINVEGASNVFQSALEVNLKRVVFTSTASVFGPSSANHPSTESSQIWKTPGTRYEQTKIECESIVREFQAKGLDIITLYPSRVFGPGSLHESNALTKVFKQFHEGKWRVIPGNGKSVGNYVFIDDVVEGHCRAMFESVRNERFLLGGENLSFNQIVAHLRFATESRHSVFHVPRAVLNGLAMLQLGSHKLLGTTPSISPSFLQKYLSDWYLDCTKARQELGWETTPFSTALHQTISWIAAQANPVD